MEQQPWLPATWDRQADVVVVGFGAAGAAAAITVNDAGAKVILLEKAPQGHEGGNTRVAGQGYLNTSAVEQAVTYLHALCGPYPVPDSMVRVWAEEMCQNNAWVASIGGDPQEHQHQPVGIEFPELPGADCVQKLCEILCKNVSLIVYAFPFLKNYFVPFILFLPLYRH